MQIIFLSGTKCLSLALNAVKFLGWLKKFGLAQNILRPVKGQGIKVNSVQEACAKCLAVHILKFEIWQTKFLSMYYVNRKAFGASFVY